MKYEYAWRLCARFCVVLFALVLQFSDASAQNSRFIGPLADHALDLDGTWTIETVSGPEGDKLFTLANGVRAANRGVPSQSSTVLWLRLKVPTGNAGDSGLVLTQREGQTREVRLYLPADSGFTETVWRLGEAAPKARLVTRYPAFAMPATTEGKTVYLRIDTRSSMRVNLWLYDEAGFIRAYLGENLGFAFFFGCLIIIFVFLAATAIAARDKPLAALALVTIAFVSNFSGNLAFIETYLWPGAVAGSRVFAFGGSWFLLMAALFYVVQELHVAEHYPRLAKIYNGFALLMLVAAVAAGVTIYADNWIMRPFSAQVGMVAIAAFLGLAIFMMRRERKRAVRLLLCWGPVAIASVARLSSDVVPSLGSHPLAINAMYFGVVVSMLLAGVAGALDIRQREVGLRRAAEDNALRLKDFADSASDSLWETNADGAVTFASGPASAAAGLMPGARLAEVLHSGGGDRALAAEPQSLLSALIFETPQGRRHLRIAGKRIHDGGWRGIITDLTEETLSRERQSQQQKMAAVGQLAGGVAHEINNLLHPMINLSRRARDNVSGEQRKWLDIVRDSGERAADIVANLLSATRPSLGEGREAPMGEAVREAGEQARTLLPVAVQLVLSVESDAGPRLRVAEVFQVIANLVTNGIHAMGGSGSVHVAYRCSDAAAVLTVSDSGVGMDEATIARAMEPFFTTKKQGEGSGLGLSIVYTIVEQWGGAMDIASRPGAGTTVTITVPLARESRETMRKAL